MRPRTLSREDYFEAAVGTLLLSAAPGQGRIQIAEHVVDVTIREERVPSDGHARGAVLQHAARQQRIVPGRALSPRAAVDIQHQWAIASPACCVHFAATRTGVVVTGVSTIRAIYACT